MRWIVVVMLAAALTADEASSEQYGNGAWCVQTAQGVLNCAHKTKAACDYALELVAFPGAKCVPNPKR
jgi:hypothetical protein